MKKFVLLLLIVTATYAHGQNIAGYWYGTATTEQGGGNNYLVELIVKQNRSSIEAIMNYYFKNTFRSIRLDGSYDAKTRELLLFNVPIPFSGSALGLEVDCMMDFHGVHRVAIAGSNLSGKLYAKENYKYTCSNILFDLKLDKNATNRDSILTALRNFKESSQVWTPTATDTLIAAIPEQRQTPVQNIIINKEYTERTIDVQKVIEVESDSLQIDIYDNGEVDGDSISVFFNDKLFGSNLRLSTKSLHYNILLDPLQEVNTLSMFANNLGTIPPNTALMLVRDGTNRYEVRLSSNLEKTATLQIKKKKKAESESR